MKKCCDKLVPTKPILTTILLALSFSNTSIANEEKAASNCEETLIEQQNKKDYLEALTWVAKFKNQRVAKGLGSSENNIEKSHQILVLLLKREWLKDDDAFGIFIDENGHGCS